MYWWVVSKYPFFKSTKARTKLDFNMFLNAPLRGAEPGPYAQDPLS